MKPEPLKDKHLASMYPKEHFILFKEEDVAAAIAWLKEKLRMDGFRTHTLNGWIDAAFEDVTND